MFVSFGTEIKTVRSRGKYLRLKIDGKTGEVYLYIPRYVSMAEAERFVVAKSEWIQSSRQKVLSRLEKENLPKDKIWLFGKECRLVFQGEQTDFKDEHFVCISAKRGDCEEKLNEAVLKLYKRELSEYITKEFKEVENLVGLKANGWRIRKMDTRWGSCNIHSGNISFSVNLAKKSKECIDYVILHEIAHLKYANHGSEFKCFLTQFMPDWKKRKKLLNGVD